MGRAVGKQQFTTEFSGGRQVPPHFCKQIAIMNLHRYITEAKCRKLRYGSHDCVTFACRWAELRSGVQFVPAYSSLKEGRLIVAEKSAVEIVAEHFEQVSPLMAQSGDLAVMPSMNDLPAFGVVYGHRIACFVGREVGFVSLTDAQTAYRIPACHQ